MKAKIIEKEKEVKFEPVTIELIIENERELCALWHRLNVSVLSIEEGNYKSINALKYQFDDDSTRLWGIIDQQVEKRKLKK